MKQTPAGMATTLRKFLELAGSAYSLYRIANADQKRRLLKTVSSNLTAREKTLDFSYLEPFRTVALRKDAQHSTPSKGLARTCDDLIAALMKQEAHLVSAIAAYEADTA